MTTTQADQDQVPPEDRGAAGPPPGGDDRVTFEEVRARAERLRDWAADEVRYLDEHDVATFTGEDRRGRDTYADEGLYELLPALRLDAAALRLRCGRGPLWEGTRALVREAGDEIQAYHARWAGLRDGCSPPTGGRPEDDVPAQDPSAQDPSARGAPGDQERDGDAPEPAEVQQPVVLHE